MDQTSRPRVVIAVDGEGYFDTDRRSHIYDMLRIGDELIGRPGHRLTLRRVAELIRSRYYSAKNKGLEPVFYGYFLNYDFTQWLRGCSTHELKRLVDRDSRKYERHARPAKEGHWSEEARQWRVPATDFHPVDTEWGYKFSPTRLRLDWVKDKSLMVSWPDPASLPAARASGEERNIKWVRTTIYDVGTAFGSGFLSTVGAWLRDELTDEEREVIAKGKANRALNLTRSERAEGWDEVAYYNMKENELCERLMHKFYNTVNATVGGGLTHKIDGPGCIAAHWLKNQQEASAYGVSDDGQRIPAKSRLDLRETSALLESDQVADLLDADGYAWVNAAYFGGWFETFSMGFVPNVCEYDLNSAYPAIIRDLPSLRDAEVRWTTDGRDALAAIRNGSIVFADVSIYGASNRIGPAMYRRGDEVTRPQSSRTIIEGQELLASRRAGLVKRVDWHRALIIKPTRENKPLSAIADMYEERLRIGKNNPTGLAIKLIVNSAYGKLAQSVGSPRFANPVYAALITARTRSLLLDAIATHPNGIEDVVAVATDAVFFRTPHPSLNISPTELGAWDVETFTNAWFLKSGIWGSTNDEGGDMLKFEWDAKTRGYSARSFAEAMESEILPRISRMHETKTWDTSESFTVKDSFSMKSIPLAIAQGRPQDAGEFMVGPHDLPEAMKSVSFEVAPKRSNPRWSNEYQGFDTSAPPPMMNRSDFQLRASDPKTELVGGLDFDFIGELNRARYTY